MTSFVFSCFPVVWKGAIGLEIVQFARLLQDISLASMQVEVSTICNGRRKDIKGEFYIASGISYGYAVPVASRLNLEFSIGIGLLRTDYKHYRAIDNYRTLLWQNSGNYTWFGPTKGKISLVWLLGRKQKGRMK